MEIRLIYVIDRRNGMPVYFRYCPGNIVDVSTLCTTVAELSQYGVSTDYAIVDAGYFSEDKELSTNNCCKFMAIFIVFPGFCLKQLQQLFSDNS